MELKEMVHEPEKTGVIMVGREVEANLIIDVIEIIRMMVYQRHASSQPRNIMTRQPRKLNRRERMLVKKESNAGRTLRVRRSQRSKSRKKEDYFKRLPDEIIACCILPRLSSFKESTRTSVLSRRWRNLWKYNIGSKLIFVDHTFAEYVRYLRRYGTLAHDDLARYLGPSYVQSVNGILQAYPHQVMDDFTLRLNFDNSYSSVIDSWLEFAFEKGIKGLELNLLPHRFDGVPILTDTQYAFPDVEKMNKLVGSSSSASFYKLTKLCLSFVNVSQEVIEYILSNCLLLEHLSVMGDYHLVHLKVTGPSLRLRCLEIANCRWLESIDISAPNLTSFKFQRPFLPYPRRWHVDEFSLRLKCVPLLSELFMSGNSMLSMVKSFSDQHFNNYICQLNTLVLHLSTMILRESIYYPTELPKLVRLKHLEVKIHAFSGLTCLLWPTSLIKAAPFLHRFTAKVIRCKSSFKLEESLLETMRAKACQYQREGPAQIEQTRALQKATEHEHECLKVVEIIGFCGYKSDVELAQHVLHIAKWPAMVVFDTSVASNYIYNHVGNCTQSNAKRRAKELCQGLPVDTELVIR